MGKFFKSKMGYFLLLMTGSVLIAWSLPNSNLRSRVFLTRVPASVITEVRLKPTPEIVFAWYNTQVQAIDIKKQSQASGNSYELLFRYSTARNTSVKSNYLVKCKVSREWADGLQQKETDGEVEIPSQLCRTINP